MVRMEGSLLGIYGLIRTFFHFTVRWLDKLGIAAKFGVDVVVRQSFYGGHYALIDSHSHDPHPVR